MSKRHVFILLGLAAGMLCLASMAGAEEPKVEVMDQPPAPEVDEMPRMEFLRGTLKRDGLGRWLLDEQPLHVREDAHISNAKMLQKRAPFTEGKTVLLMGCRRDDLFVVYRGIMQPSDLAQHSTMDGESIIWSESDPNVGEGDGPQ